MRLVLIMIGTVFLLSLTIFELSHFGMWPFAKPCGPVTDRPLRVGITPWVGFAGGILSNGGYRSSDTNKTEWANKFGVIFVNPDTLPSREAALRGSACDGVDVLWSSIPTWAAELPQFKTHGVKARVIAAIARSSSLHVLSTINPSRLDQLRESMLVTPSFMPAHWLARLNGLTKIQLVNSPNDAIADSSPGNILAISEPDVYKVAQRPDAQYLRAIDSKTDVIYILVAREEAIENASMPLQAFVKDWLQGNRELQYRKKELAAYLSNIPGEVSIPANQLEAELEHVHLANEEDNVALFESQTKKEKESFDWQFYDASIRWGKEFVNPVNPISSEEAKASKLIRAINSISSDSVRAEKALCEPNAKVATVRSLTVLFDPPGSYDVLPQFRHELDVAGLILKTQPTAQVCIVGHTDNTGESGNNQLSEKRANAVGDVLRSPTVSKERMIISWKGSREPVAKNISSDGQRSNRRAEITIVTKGTDEEISYLPQDNRRVKVKAK